MCFALLAEGLIIIFLFCMLVFGLFCIETNAVVYVVYVTLKNICMNIPFQSLKDILFSWGRCREISRPTRR